MHCSREAFESCNLATNDFGGAANPDRAGWTGVYRGFVQRVREHYRNADIYVALGSMMNDQLTAALENV